MRRPVGTNGAIVFELERLSAAVADGEITLTNATRILVTFTHGLVSTKTALLLISTYGAQYASARRELAKTG